ncbi:hypothetical protein B0F90DRAFT_442425 [Multifurca ochricompacta]|uniref:Crinkler effector protein N-terminal domain-containing protein n=1 Tax=Multifurca ochricompacta TaxID=376703 RepID=A0AAD4QJ07_9AGAM|nr:hypothetical protein B0F90DRAFT_442425 [Multifurca ochricompacta]
MTTELTLFCLAIDSQNVPIGNVLKLEIQSDDDASDLKEAIKAKMAPRLDNLAANELILWELLKPVRVPSPVKIMIAAIEFPDSESKVAFDENGTVQVLHPAVELSDYWENPPKRGHLHIVVQVPLATPSILPEYPILEGLPGNSHEPLPFADQITFSVPSEECFLRLYLHDISPNEVKYVSKMGTPSYIHNFQKSLNHQHVISPNVTGLSMLREYLGNSFDTYF